jgi:hypothetical protein
LEFLHFINCHRNWERAAKKRFPDDPFKDNRPIDAQFGSAKDLFLGFQFREWPLVLQSDGDNRLSGSLIKSGCAETISKIMGSAASTAFHSSVVNAALPSTLMKSRRLMPDMGLPPTP